MHGQTAFLKGFCRATIFVAKKTIGKTRKHYVRFGRSTTILSGYGAMVVAGQVTFAIA